VCADYVFDSGDEIAVYLPLDFFVQEGFNITTLADAPTETSSHASVNNANEEPPIGAEAVAVSPDTDFNMVPPTESQRQSPGKCLSSPDYWADEEISLLLTAYAEYFPLVGKSHGFRRKADMWAKVSEDIENKFHVSRTANQCKTK
jgi:Myb/SANT-like DNA-binding domain